MSALGFAKPRQPLNLTVNGKDATLCMIMLAIEFLWLY